MHVRCCVKRLLCIPNIKKCRVVLYRLKEKDYYPKRFYVHYYYKKKFPSFLETKKTVKEPVRITSVNKF